MAAGLDGGTASLGRNKALEMIGAGKLATPFKAARRLGIFDENDHVLINNQCTSTSIRENRRKQTGLILFQRLGPGVFICEAAASRGKRASGSLDDGLRE
ncbi:hypothetical protein [Polaromonas sp. UC242_47]|uniref:hypothetical protein n=1 Tax=Polaromonas sp. UC242_47 TaxID=3374626 RepID=UPI0037B13109